ncbi:hypothetical protein CEC48_07795 [Pseudomonas sp. K2I15]|nr:hypothetical protein CEC48_07795 [Pseudomonas sp. K2I15]
MVFPGAVSAVAGLVAALPGIATIHRRNGKTLRSEPAFVARELAPAGLRSSPIFGVASQPSGSKLPRHNKPAPKKYCAQFWILWSSAA